MKLHSSKRTVLSRIDFALLVAFGVVVTLFALATIISQGVERSIEYASAEITSNASPDVQFLSAARSDLSQHQVALDDYLDAFELGPNPDRSMVDQTWSQMDGNLERYGRSGVFPGERQLADGLGQNINRLRTVRSEVLALASAGNWRRAVELEKRQLDPLTDIVRAQFDQLIAMNASESAILASRIADEHRRASTTAVALDVACALLSLGVAMLLVHFVRGSRRKLETRSAELEVKSAELEEFSGRMAHDVVSPLLAASLGWDLVQRIHPDDARLRQIADVSRSAIKQSQRLVSDLLAFAMAGARPADGTTAELRPVLTSVLESLRAEADEAHATLEAQVPDVADIACAPGVLTSVLSNLVRNAIKHMGVSPTRRVSVRGEASPSSVRVEISDTGQGIPFELQQTIFEPYVRGPTKASGLGLGLATVKRLVDAHGGRVGVRSSLGHGATFWFELPRSGVERRLALISGEREAS